jgi:hypothetical protein
MEVIRGNQLEKKQPQKRARIAKKSKEILSLEIRDFQGVKKAVLEKIIFF